MAGHVPGQNSGTGTHTFRCVPCPDVKMEAIKKHKSQLNHGGDIMSEDNIKQVSVTPEQAAELYGLNIGSLANMRCRKQGPRYYKVGKGKKVVYRVEDLEQWLFNEPVMTIDQHQLDH